MLSAAQKLTGPWPRRLLVWLLHPDTVSFLRGIADSFANQAFLYEGTYVKCLC